MLLLRSPALRAWYRRQIAGATSLVAHHGCPKPRLRCTPDSTRRRPRPVITRPHWFPPIAAVVVADDQLGPLDQHTPAALQEDHRAIRRDCGLAKLKHPLRGVRPKV